MTEAELLWLSDWYDQQPEPDQVTLEQANTALASHRASSGGTSAFTALHEALEAQWLRAKLRAAEIRMNKAASEVARWKAAIDEPAPHKKQRTREREPRPYDNHALEEWQRQESMTWTRRRVELSDDKAARLRLQRCHVASALGRSTTGAAASSAPCRTGP